MSVRIDLRVALARGLHLALLGCAVLLGCDISAALTDRPGQSDDPAAVAGPRWCLENAQQAYDLLFEPGLTPLCPNATGNGAFGEWIVDDRGGPAYSYAIDPDSDPRAVYQTSRGDSTDHWHMLGNAAIAATAHNRGHVELYDLSRGPKLLNHWEPRYDNYSGGFHWLRENGRWWCTHWSVLPQGARQERRFGRNYFERRTTYNDLLVIERVSAPLDLPTEGRPDDLPALISEVTLRDLSGEARDVALYEYWDSNPLQLLPVPVSGGPLRDLLEWLRGAINRGFTLTSGLDSLGCLRVADSSTDSGGTGECSRSGLVDRCPATLFLAPLQAEVEAAYADQARFFGDGGLSAPAAVQIDGPSMLFDRINALHGPALLAFRSRASLAPGGAARTAFCVGYATDSRIEQTVERCRRRAEEGADHETDALDSLTLDALLPGAPHLRREGLWHAAQLIGGAYYQEYYDASALSQGSAYLYVQGADGAPRDLALFVLPLVWVYPELARDTLRLLLRSQDADDGALAYARVGFGRVTGAAVHSNCSDADLFLLLAVAEYLGATRDYGLLEQVLPYYPLSAGVAGTVAEHLRAALDHFVEDVGFGAHGLVRVGSGDWNDALLTYASAPLGMVLHGESHFNTALAAVALQRLADALAAADPELAGRCAALAEQCRLALRQEWEAAGAGWMPRAYDGDGRLMGADRIFMDTQPWVLLSGALEPDQEAALAALIRSEVDEPSPFGLPALSQPFDSEYLEPWSDTNGGTWAAIDSWMVWAYAGIDPAWAYELLDKSSLARHAEVYPDVWYGIWSGPDSINADRAEQPGETFVQSFTDMRDFPVMNMNRHSGPLLGLLRLAGLGFDGQGLVIDPRLPLTGFSLRTRLAGVAYLEQSARGYYDPQAGADLHLRVRLPSGLPEERAQLLVNGRLEQARMESGFCEFDVRAEPGSRITWEIGGGAGSD